MLECCVCVPLKRRALILGRRRRFFLLRLLFHELYVALDGRNGILRKLVHRRRHQVRLSSQLVERLEGHALIHLQLDVVDSRQLFHGLDLAELFHLVGHLLGPGL